MVKILFLIHDLGQGGAEKVLVNLVNNLDRNLFEISLTVLFGGGVNEQFLAPDIHFHAVFKKMLPGNSKWMKSLSPKQLHRLCVKEHYDIEVSYLEGPSARVISGCENPETKKICWIHSNHFSMGEVTAPFRSEKEAVECYTSFDSIVCVSRFMQENFCQWMPVQDRCVVLYNTIDSEDIQEKAKEPVPELDSESGESGNSGETRLSHIPRLVAVGTLKEVKGFDRLLRIVKRLKEEGVNCCLYILGKGPLEQELQRFIDENGLADDVKLLGYQLNPYKYVSRCDLYVCSSHSEGFSTAATEALIVGTPVCTVDVSGMKELLGENNEYGVVTENNEEALYQGIKSLLLDKKRLADYAEKAKERGNTFDTESTVKAVEDLFL